MTILGVVAILVVAIMFMSIIERNRLRRLGESRHPMSPDDFVCAFVAGGATRETAEFLQEVMKDHYRLPLAPDPQDRLDSTMRIDGDHQGDIAEAYFDRFGLYLPRSEWPVVMPEDPTLLEFAIWLEGQRASPLMRVA